MLPATRTPLITLLGFFALMGACTEEGRVNDRPYNPESDGGTDGDTDGDSDSDSDSDSDGDSDGDSDSDSDDTCDEQSFNMERVPVKLMILQDLSISMEDGVPTKWSQTKSAIGTMLDTWKGQNIEFGLDKFPKPADVSDSCGDDCAIGDSATPDELGALTEELLAKDIMTIAIGFGQETEPGELNAIAAAGGTQFDEYLQADDEGCQDGYGWHWVDDDTDTMEIEFCQEACTELTGGLVDEVTAKFGCKTVEVV